MTINLDRELVEKVVIDYLERMTSDVEVEEENGWEVVLNKLHLLPFMLTGNRIQCKIYRDKLPNPHCFFSN